ncbi:MAG: CARDB domain-containing protein [Thermoplasmatota archaeon]
MEDLVVDMSSRVAAVVLILCIMIILPGSMADTDHRDLLVPDPDFDPSAGVDIPTWRMGDYWNYSTSFSVSYLGFNVPVTGWMNMSTAFITQDLTQDNSPVYITDIVGNLTGRLYIPLLGINETIYVNLTGYLWERIQDLSVYRMVVNASVSGTLTSINGNYPFGYEYDPPLEQYDFPLVPEEEWEVNVTAKVPFGGSGEITSVLQNMSCGTPVQRTVPAGTFMTYPVHDDDVPVLYYNRTIGNTVERVFEMDIQGLPLTVPWELNDYQRYPEEQDIWIWVDTDEPVLEGSSFELSGALTTGNTIVTVMFPGGQIAATIPLTGPQQTFTRTLTAPRYPDDTPTSFDHASFGIFAIIGALEEYDVCTVTTKALDLMVDESSLRILHTNEGTKDDLFTADFTVYNNMNHGTGTFSLQLLYGNGTQAHSETVDGLQAKESYTNSVLLGKLPPGNHSLELKVDVLDEVHEYSETNNDVKVLFTVKERPSLNMTSSIPTGDIFFNEGEWVNITAAAYRGGEPVPTWNWSIDGTEVDQDNHLNISLDFTGSLSSRDSPYIITYSVDPSCIFDDENGTLVWRLTVSDVNRAPQLLNFSPSEAELDIEEGGSVEFSIEIVDPDMTTPLIEWRVNGEAGSLQPADGNSVMFFSDHTGPNSSRGSPFFIEVKVFDSDDPSLNITHNWTVNVLDIDLYPAVNITPSPGSLEVDHNGSLEFIVVVEDPDGDPVHTSWYLNGWEVGNLTGFKFSPIEYDLVLEETVDLELLVTAGTYSESFNWSIRIIPPEEPEEPEPLPPSGISISSPGEGEIFDNTEEIIFRAEHNDSRPLSFIWYINGTFYEGQSVTLSGLPLGSYAAVLNVSTEGPPPGWLEMTVHFTVIQKYDGTHGPVDGEKDQWPWWILIFPGIIIVAAMVFALMAYFRRNEWNIEE